jgi:tRNA threonylcarbamoyladenosine biosynthesis protein TsaE
MDGRGAGRGELFRGRRERILETFLNSEEETKRLAKEFAKTLLPGDVVCLIGDLGAGKTTFTKGVASHFGVSEDVVSSPTFVYMNLYDNIAHFDLYRLASEEQFLSMGFDEYFEKPYIAIVEWPNLLDESLPKDSYWVVLTHHMGGRKVEIEKRVKA